MREVWIGDFGPASYIVPFASRREADGYDGMVLGDSQSRYGDTFVSLALVVGATERLKVGTAVVNPVTRHPAVVAAAIGSLHQYSNGRAVLGIGRGDSALAFLGSAPASLPTFERFLDRVQGYLAGDAVELDAATFTHDGERVRSIAELDLADVPSSSRIRWLPGEIAKGTR